MACQLQRREILNLQCLRGFAAMLVIGDHLLERLINRGAYPQSLRDTAWALGELGVETFFAISGFIMVHTTRGQFGRAGATWRFIRRRFVRVLPLYYVTTLAMILFVFAVKHALPSGLDVIKSVAFIPYVDGSGLMQPVYGLGWTLEYEMFFYAVFGLCLCLRAHIGLPLAIGCLLMLVASGIFTPDAAQMKFSVTLFYFSRPILIYFVLGMMLGLLLGATGATKVRWLPNAALCAIGLASMLSVPLICPHVRGSLLGLPAVALALVCAVYFEGADRPHAFAWLSREAGDLSYSLYLTHSFLLGAIASIVASSSIPRLPLVGLPIIICGAGGVCVVVAWCAWRFCEQPLARRCAQLVGSPPARSALCQAAPAGVQRSGEAEPTMARVAE